MVFSDKCYGDWYPGDDYVDVVGADSYTDGPNNDKYKNIVSIVGDRKPICFHECGKNTYSGTVKDNQH